MIIANIALKLCKLHIKFNCGVVFEYILIRIQELVGWRGGGNRRERGQNDLQTKVNVLNEGGRLFVGSRFIQNFAYLLSLCFLPLL